MASGITTAGIVSRAGEAYDAQARNLKRCGEEFSSTERRRKWQRKKARRSRTRVEKENRTSYCADCISGRWWRGTQASNCSWQPPSAFTRARPSFASVFCPSSGHSGLALILGSPSWSNCAASAFYPALVPASRRFHAQDTEAAFVVMEGDALDQP